MISTPPILRRKPIHQLKNTFETLSFLTGKDVTDKTNNTSILPSPKEQGDIVAGAVLGKGKDIIDMSQRKQKENDINNYLTPDEKKEYYNKNSVGYGDAYLKSKKTDIDIRKGEAIAKEYISGNFGEKLAIGLDVYLGVGSGQAVKGQVSAIENISNLIAGKDANYKTENTTRDYANYYLKQYFEQNDKKIQSTIQDITVNIANNLTAQAAGMLTGSRVVALIPFALSVFGNAFEDAKLTSNDNSKALLYALTNTTSETALEAALGYIPFAKGIFSDTIKNNAVKSISNLWLRNVAKLGLNASGEVLEESIQEGINPFLKKPDTWRK